MIKKVCARCAKPYEVKAYRAHTSFYCSFECTKHNKSCENCGKRLTKRPGRRRFCSRACSDPFMTGPNNPVWKGGISKNNPRYELIHELTAWSKTVLKKDGYECQICNTLNGPFHAHHIKSFSKYPNLRLRLSNGLTLCIPCHEKIHGGKPVNKRGKKCPLCKGPKTTANKICIKCAKGSLHHRSKLTEDIVIQIRKDRMTGLKWILIGEKYNIDPTTAQKAASGKTWKHVTSV